MAFEIVDGMTGTKHISSDDLSALNVATIGKADCVLKYGDDFKLTMASANSATLGTGVGMVGGKRFWTQAATSLTVQSGTQGQKRNDLVVARYAKTSAGIESITPVVIKGTPTTGTAADPEVTANDLKLWRVPLDGISVGEPVKLFEPVASLATLVDSVSPTVLYINNNAPLQIPHKVTIDRNVNDFDRLVVFGSTNEYKRCSVELIKSHSTGQFNDMYFTLLAYNGEGYSSYLKMTDYKISISGSTTQILPISFNQIYVQGTSACGSQIDIGVDITAVYAYKDII